MNKELKVYLIGKGEVSGFEYAQIARSTTAYLYEVRSLDTNIHYEVFKRKNVALCIDFDKHIYSETETKDIYPKTKDFGIWAWTYKTLTVAQLRFNKL